MTTRDLDRLVSRTEMTPAAKQSLRVVRKAVVKGRCGDAEVGHGSWSVTIDNLKGTAMTMNFQFKRDSNADRK